jgi:hypothetical protein
VKNYIDYKWDKFGFKAHIGNLLCHTLYITFLIQFINWNFIHCPHGYQDDDGKWHNDCIRNEEEFDPIWDKGHPEHKDIYDYKYMTW